jgi:hypothetical protein
VVLVLSDDPVDEGRYRAPAIREYLRELHVPLFVWSVEGSSEEGIWGPARNVSTPNKLNKASRSLMKDLERQWVVWIEGRHLPYEIDLSPEAERLEIAQ